MKNIWKLLALPLALSLAACNTYRYDDDYYNQLPCERDRVGTVCFQNDTRRLIKMEMDGAKVEIESYTTLCIDVYEGAQEYKGKQGLRRWRGFVEVYPCEQYFVELDR